MQKLLIALTSATMLLLGGCTGTMPPDETPAPQADVKPPVAEAAAKPSLTDEAKAALAQAEMDVKAAQAKKALWSTAKEELKKAEAAAEEFDSQTVIKHAKIASDHAKLGIEQLKDPMTTVK